ncbi:MAG: ribonuclease HI [Deltaproteobacteria bacterium]|nr:ribonuclease HI [Deltaproteobacteria bacterium]
MADHLNWKRMMFKGCKVYAQTDETGKLLTKDGMVTVKYQLQQDQEYRARAASVTEIDEARLRAIKEEKKKKRDTPVARHLSGGFGENQAEEAITIFTDGACEGNPGPAGIGVVLQYRDRRKEISRFIGLGTNNVAELTAIKIALQEIKNADLPITLYTDSIYAAQVIRGAWKAKKNQTLVDEIKKEMAGFPHLSIIKIAGHKGIEDNETADRLARQAIKKGTDKKSKE